MKKYGLTLAAALTVALVAAGGAFAKGHSKSLVPTLVRPHVWVKLLREFPRDPKPLQGHGFRHTIRRPHAASRRQAAHHRPAARRHHTVHRLRGTTLSLYEQSAKPWVLREQGCTAARRHESGVVVLDFGKPAYEGSRYGTILFSNHFASNPEITSAMLGYAHGYVRCLPRGSTASITLARGTSNYHPAVPSAYTAGVRWAAETKKFDLMLHHRGYSAHVTAAAADDAEPAWDPRFRKTRQFIHGYRMGDHRHTLYDYGSLDGGIGSIWGPRQAFFVAGGISHTAALPEIYNSAMAREWAQLARVARSRYHRAVHFAGVMTQGTSHCHCGLRPHAAHHALTRALASVGVRSTVVPRGGTNIVG